MLIPVGQPAVAGPGAGVEYIDRLGQFSIAAAKQLVPGQVLCRDLTALAGQASANAPAADRPVSGGQCEQVVLPTDAAAGDPFGVYQGPLIDNSTGTAALVVTVACRFRGYGSVLIGAHDTTGTKIDVGDPLITEATKDYAITGARVVGVAVGRALATVVAGTLVNTVGDTLLAVPDAGDATLLINADINCY